MLKDEVLLIVVVILICLGVLLEIGLSSWAVRYVYSTLWAWL